jgi:hypothetical protein
MKVAANSREGKPQGWSAIRRNDREAVATERVWFDAAEDGVDRCDRLHAGHLEPDLPLTVRSMKLKTSIRVRRSASSCRRFHDGCAEADRKRNQQCTNSEDGRHHRHGNIHVPPPTPTLTVILPDYPLTGPPSLRAGDYVRS